MENIEIEKAEEGVQFQEQELPLDINYSKLTEWLNDRKKLHRDWRKRLNAIQARTSKELGKLPKGKYSQQSEGISYLEALNIRKNLLADSDSRSMFGGLSGVAGVWDSIVKAYERDGLFLGEASQILVQYTNYEIPFLKNQISKHQQQSSDFERKAAEYKRAAVLSAQKYREACEHLGVQGLEIKKEVQELVVKKLPGIFDSVVSAICSEEFEEAIELYQSFTAFLHSEGKDNVPVEVLPILRELRRNAPELGTTTVPSLSNTLDIQDSNEAVREAPTGINWDFGVIESETKEKSSIPAPLIVWDIDPASLEEPSGNLNELDGNLGNTPEISDGSIAIDWNIEITADNLEVPHLTEESSEKPLEIDWNLDIIDIERDGETGAGADGPQVNGDSSGGNLEVDWNVIEVANESVFSEKSEKAIHPLAQSEKRNALLDDLLELHAFLSQRVSELKRGEFEVIQSRLFLNAPPIVLRNDLASVQKLTKVVLEPIQQLTEETTKNLLRIFTSPRYVERLTATLEQKKGQELKVLQSLKDLEKRHQELKNSMAATWPLYESAVKRAKAVKQMVEDNLSKQLNGRPVNIIGEINNILDL